MCQIIDNPAHKALASYCSLADALPGGVCQSEPHTPDTDKTTA
jgi:hypothetical protein